ncbi:hypothetical protein JCM8547_008644 [Rhodosporidiobolus lusitaniae]
MSAATLTVRRSPRHHLSPLPSLAGTSPPHPTPPLSRSSFFATHGAKRIVKGVRRASKGTPAASKSHGTAGEGGEAKAPADREDENGGTSEGTGEGAVGRSDEAAEGGTGRATASSSSGALPSLLSHIVIGPSFTYTTSDPSSSKFTFTPSASSFSDSPETTFTASPPSPSSSCTCTKRSSHSTSPNPHLFPSPERIKKRKLRHRYFRSDALFSSPSSPPSASQPRPRPLGRSLSASGASWWPSASRQAESRFAPAEEEWTGSGEEWEKAAEEELALSFSSFGLSSSSPENSALHPSPPVRPTLPRSFSSPASLGHRPPSFSLSPPPEKPQQEEHDAAALKRLLLKNLRMRMASEGGTSKAGEAGLRFKKWVVYNAFTRRQRELDSLSLGSPEDDYTSSSSSDDSLGGVDAGDLSAFFAGDDEDMGEGGGDFCSFLSSTEHGDANAGLPDPPALLASQQALAAMFDGVEQEHQQVQEEEEDYPSFGSSFFLPVPLPLPSLDETSAKTEEQATPRTMADFSLSPSSSSSSFTSSSFTSPSSAPSSSSAPVRPGMKRTMSLPNVPYSSSTSSSTSSPSSSSFYDTDHDYDFDTTSSSGEVAGAAGGGWTAQVVVCEGCVEETARQRALV